MLLCRQLDLLLYQLLADWSRVSDVGDDDGRLTAGSIAGIVVAVIVCCVSIAVVVVTCVKRRGCVTRRQPTSTAAS